MTKKTVVTRTQRAKEKPFNPPRDNDIQTGNRFSCAGTMILPSQSKRTRLVRILLLWLGAPSAAGTMSCI